MALTRLKKIVSEQTDYLNVFQSLPHAPADYKFLFQQAQLVFQHQTVIDPRQLHTVPLNPCKNALDKDMQHICGEYPFVLEIIGS